MSTFPEEQPCGLRENGHSNQELKALQIDGAGQAECWPAPGRLAHVHLRCGGLIAELAPTETQVITNIVIQLLSIDVFEPFDQLIK